MIELRGLTILDQSVSHWGIFPIGRRPVEFQYEDCGLDPITKEYVGNLIVGDTRHEVRVDQCEVQKFGPRARQNVEREAIRRAGIDLDTIELKHDGSFIKLDMPC